MTDRFKDVLNTLGQLQAWAEVGIQRAPAGKTVIDVNWAGIFIREYLNEAEQLRNKLKPHPDCDRACMFLCEGEADLVKEENEQLRKERDELAKYIIDLDKALNWHDLQCIQGTKFKTKLLAERIIENGNNR